MLRYRDQVWLLNRMRTRIEVWVPTGEEARTKPAFDVELEYHAGGAEWLGVDLSQRPHLTVRVGWFQPEVTDWRKLKGVSFWHPMPDDGFLLLPRRGVAEIRLRHPMETPARRLHTDTTAHAFRFMQRDGPFFLMELATLADGTSIYRAEAEDVAVPVGPDGTPVPVETDEAFWRRVQPQLYLIEEVPFGLVTVRLPHNSRQPEAQAKAIVRRWLNCGEPDWVEVWNFWEPGKGLRESQTDDWLWIKLHYGGDWRD